MTKKHYTMLAKCIRAEVDRQRENGGDNRLRLEVAKEIAWNIAESCVEDNPKFNRFKFIEACGFKPDSL